MLGSKSPLKGHKAPNTSVQYNMSEASSMEAALLEMNVSAKYLSVNASAQASLEKNSKRHTIYAYFIQGSYTVNCDNHGKPQNWFTKDLTWDALATYDPVYIGKKNPPLYMSALSYGRSLIFGFHTTHDVTKARAALQASWDSGANKVEGNVTMEYQNILDTAEVTVIARGGPNKDIAQLIRTDQLHTYFSDDILMEDCVPVSYTLKDLATAEIATMAETAQYNIVQRSPIAFTFDLTINEVRGKFRDLCSDWTELTMDNFDVEGAGKKDFGVDPASSSGYQVKLNIKDGGATFASFSVPVSPEMFRTKRSVSDAKKMLEGGLSKEIDYTLTMVCPTESQWHF
ncbi:thiol-activated cytolysin family protein [Streptomyces sp. NPDC049555]|uniref:thiol-activated cytolysin family protein n=1 Tax=unclassified Streptomyces TaxID=2593676 RepID=UPI00344A3858